MIDEPTPEVATRYNRSYFMQTITAAANTLRTTLIARPQTPKNGRDAEAQREVWVMYDRVGELHFGLRWKGQAVSLCKIKVAYSETLEQVPLEPKEGEIQDANDLVAINVLRGFAGGDDGQANLLRQAAIQVDAVGECYIVQYASDGRVRAYAPNEVKKQGEVWLIGNKALAAEDVVLHVRQPHPAESTRVDSAVLAALPVLRKLHGLNQAILGAIDSRLAGAGLLVIPQGWAPPKAIPTDADGTAEVDPSTADPFLIAMVEAMMTPLEDPGTAASVVPLLIRKPDGTQDKAELIRFDQAFDPQLKMLRDEAKQELGTALDMPAEIITGLGDINHWGQWFTDESATKYGVKPLAELIVEAIATVWYQVALQVAEVDNPSRYTLVVDTSDLKGETDDADNAVKVYDRGELTGAALRRATRFEESDEPDDAERQRIIDLTQALKTRTTGQPPGGPNTDEPSQPKGPPAPAATPAAHVAVVTALASLGRRWVGRNRTARGSAVAELDPTQLYLTEDVTSLDATWPIAARDALSALAGICTDCEQIAVAAYLAEILEKQATHTVDALAIALAACSDSE